MMFERGVLDEEITIYGQSDLVRSRSRRFFWHHVYLHG